MVAAINEDRPPIVDGREARKAIEIISGIYRSSRSGMPVNLPL
jgi:predicted dehydrogenase